MVADATALLASRIVVAAMGWAGTLLIVRSLSPTAWGQFSFVFNILSLAWIVTSAVGPRVAIRGLLDQSGEGPSRFAGSYIVLRTVLGVLAYLLMLGLVIAGRYPAVVVRATALAGLVVIISSTSGAHGIIFQVNQRMRRWALAQALGQAAQLILTVGLWAAGASLVVFTLPAIAGEVVILASVLYSVRSLLKVRLGVIFSTWGTLVRASIPIGVGQGLFAVYNSVDSVMLSKLKTFSAVGAYGIAYKFSNIVVVVPIAMTGAVMGTLVRSWPDVPEVFWAAFRRSLVLLFMVAVLVSVEFGVFADPVVRLLYGDEYGPAAGAARLVVIGACVSFFTVLVTAALTSQGRNAAYLVAGGVGVVVNIAANLVAIPRWSYRGAAWVTLGTERVVVAIVIPVVLRDQRVGDVVPWESLGRSVALGAACLAAALVARVLLPWPVALATSLIIAGFGVHVLRVPGPRGLRSLLSDAIDV